MQHKTQQTIVSILKWSVIILLGSAVFAPLLVWSKYLFPFITTKTLFFRLVVELALILYVFLCFCDARFRPRWKSSIVYLFGVYVLLQTVMSLFGESFYKSFWGTVERGEGLILLYHLFIWFIMLRAMCSNEQVRLGFLHVGSFATFMVALYGLAQWLNASFVLFPGEGRIASTLGNASFFAGYMLFGIGVAFRFILDQTQRMLVRVVYGIVALLEIVMLYQSETRGALLGLIGAVVLYGILALYKGGSRRVKLASLGLVAVAFVFVGSVMVFRNSTFVRSHNTLYRLGSIVSPGDITKQSRLYAWDSSWKAFLDRPLTGYGFEHYNIAFNRYFHPEIYMDQGSQVWFDRAHNGFFDVLVTGGVLTFLVYCGLFIATLWLLFKRFRTADHGVVTYGVFICIIASYLFQNLFVFDTLPLYLWIVLVLAIVSGLVESSSSGEHNEGSVDSLRKTFGLEHAVIGTGLIIAFLILARQTLLLPHQAASKAVLGLAYQRSDMVAQGMNLMIEAIDLDTNYTYEIRHKFAEQAIYADRNSKVSTDEKQRYLRIAIDAIKTNLESIPHDVQNHLYLITLYNIYDAYDPTVLSLVYPLGRDALVLSPTRPQIYYGLGQAALTQKRNEEGVEYFEKALALNKAPIESSWNLAAAYEIAGRTADAERVFADLEARGVDLHSSSMLQRMIPVYSETGNYKKLEELYLELTKLDPNNVDWWVRLAAVYGKLNRLNDAKLAVEKAVALSPELKSEADAFLQSIGVK